MAQQQQQTLPKVGSFCWNELATPNLKAAKDFYGKTFGWKFHDQPMGDTVYTMIEIDGARLGGIWSIPKEQQAQIPPHWIAYILVENLEKSVETARKNGATIIKDATKAGDMGRFAIIKDPTGAHIALWQPLKM